MFSIGTITISNETVSLLSVRVFKIKIIAKFEPKLATLDQKVTKVMSTTTKSKDLYVRPKISLEDKVYLETYYHHTQDDIQVDETLAKIQV